jgi:cytochrome c oxidase subunit II
VRPRLLAIGSSATLALVLATSALAGNGGLAPVPPESPNGSRISDIYWVILGVTGAIFLLVEIALVTFIVRFRSRGRGRSVEGPQIRGHHRLELVWTAVPILILAGIAAFTFYQLPGINDVPKAGAAGPMLRMEVVGRQFYWEITYPNGVITVDRMRIPVERPVRLEVTAPTTDVIHSWWVPELGGKLDAIPGRKNHTWFEARRSGTWRLRCAEFCGIQHAEMLGVVEALPARQFDRWLSHEAATQQTGTSDLGQQTFTGACSTCHGLQGKGGVGPAISGSGVITDRKALGDLLQHGRGQMPAVGHDWPKKQTDALFAYLKSHVAAGAASGG